MKLIHLFMKIAHLRSGDIFKVSRKSPLFLLFVALSYTADMVRFKFSEFPVELSDDRPEFYIFGLGARMSNIINGFL
jgi:hypothetical protein